MARPYLGGSSAASVSKTASFSIGTSDHGKAFILSGSAITVISGDDSEHVISGGASKIYYHGSYGTDHATNTGRDIHETVSSLTLNAGAINDTIDIFCDGTNWYCSGSTKATVDAS
jgi:hypothetical protein